MERAAEAVVTVALKAVMLQYGVDRKALFDLRELHDEKICKKFALTHICAKYNISDFDLSNHICFFIHKFVGYY